MNRDDQDLRDNPLFQALVKELRGQSDEQLDRFSEWLNEAEDEESNEENP